LEAAVEAAAEEVAAAVEAAAVLPKKRNPNLRKKKRLPWEVTCSEGVTVAAVIIRSLLPHQRCTNPSIQMFHYNPLLLVFLKA